MILFYDNEYTKQSKRQHKRVMGRVCGCGTLEFHNAGVPFQNRPFEAQEQIILELAEWGQIQFLFPTMFAVCLVASC